MARPVHLTTGRDDQRLASPLSPRFRLTTPSRETFETATTGKSDQAILSQRELSSNPNEQAKESYLDAKWRIQRLWHSFLARPLFVFVAITSIALLALTITLAVYLPAQKRRREQQHSGGGSTTTPAMSNSTISISSIAPAASTFPPILAAFVSFAIEFAFFPDFAGNNTSPNTFSDNLLNNIGNISGTKPYIRVGGNTQDYALYDSSQETAVVGVYDYAATQNYPTTVHVGPSFFESYNAWPNTKFTHGFNLGRANTPAGWQSLLDTVPLACAALQNDNLLWWEYGNEPDLYDGGQPVQLRTDPWNYSLYIDQWKNGTAAIKVALDAACPTLDTDATYGYVGPSYAYRGFSPQATFANGLNENGTIKLISMHHYMGDTRTPGVSLQGTLMNHTNVALSLSSQLQQELITLSNASLVDPKNPTTQISLILNEANSLTSNTFGPKGILGTFGNALWTLDYMLFAATLGISRIHMQQGTDFRYGSWQPITTANLTKQTMAPYYGNIAVATMLGNITEATPQIVNLEMGSDYEAAYTAYTNGNLVRATILNLQEYNTTALSGHITPGARPNNTYTLDLGLADGTEITIQRLLADGSDARRGITFDGWSYEFDLDEGRPVRLNNITVGETVTVVDGSFQVSVPASSAVILNF